MQLSHRSSGRWQGRANTVTFDLQISSSVTPGFGWDGSRRGSRCFSGPKKQKARAEGKGINWAKGFLREKRHSPRERPWEEKQGLPKNLRKGTEGDVHVSLTLELGLFPLFGPRITSACHSSFPRGFVCCSACLEHSFLHQQMFVQVSGQ